MPLSFTSLSHGDVAFGFFNIETDLLLLNRLFLFASDFCTHIKKLAEREADDFSPVQWEIYRLAPEDIGDLPGAIRGLRLNGFIGEVYRHFPFPQDPKAFKQNPEGFNTRAMITGLIQNYSRRSPLTVTLSEIDQTIRIGEYLFSREGLAELLNYVWLGGYPRWKEGVRPDYVLDMIEAVAKSRHPLFKGVDPGNAYDL